MRVIYLHTPQRGIIVQASKEALKKKLAKKLADQPVQAPENPYWEMENNQIWDKRDGGKPFDVRTYRLLLETVTHYFQTVYDAFGTEAQVLVFDEEMAKHVDTRSIPQIPSPTLNPCFTILVLPQDNSWGGTTISEAWWQKNIASKGITPLMRIHSHHILDAYQSHTDWSTLNSNTLEVVIGRIDKDTPAIGYWLDILGTNNKEIVSYTDDFGLSVQSVKSGKTKKPHKHDPTPMQYGKTSEKRKK